MLTIIISDNAKGQFCKIFTMMGQNNVAPCVKLNDNQILVEHIHLEYLADMKISCHAGGVYAANRFNLFEFYVFEKVMN